MRGIWAELGIPAGSDRDTIRRAYARKLRVTNPEDDAEGFKRLRAAYDSALAHADHAAHWGDFEDEEESANEQADASTPAEMPPMPDPLERPEPTSQWSDTPAVGEESSAEAIALRAVRDSDLAALRRAMGDLDTALRGVWRAPDAALETLFAAILAAPALGEIAIRSDVEAWAAQLIADTIPRSDAILAQAVTAFGWDSGRHQRAPYAVQDVIGRLDEWRQIAALGKPAHTLHAAWQSLTRPPASHAYWRIKALSPGLARGVRSLLGEYGWVSPGLHFSFNAASLERWHAHFAKPRLTYGMLMLAFAVWTGVHLALGTIPELGGRVPYVAGALVLAASVAAPFLALQIERRRHARAATGQAPSALFRSGWIPAFGLLGLAAILLPATPATAMLVTAAGLIVLGWIVVAADAAYPTPSWPSVLRWMIGGWLYAVLGVPIAARLVPGAQVVLGVVFLLAVTIRLTMIEQARQALDRLAPLRPVTVGASIIAGILALGGLATWARLALYCGGDGAVFIGGALTLLIALPWFALFGARHVRWVAAAHIAAMIAFVMVAGPLLPDLPKDRTRLNTSQTSEASRQRQLQSERAKFADIARNNPATYAEIDAALGRYYRGALSDDAANAAISDALNAAYNARIADAPTALLVEERRIALAQLRALQATDTAACATGKLSALKMMPVALGARADALFRAVAGSAPASPAERRAGKAVSTLQQAREAATKLGKPLDDIVTTLNDKAQTSLGCAVRVAMLEALLTHPDAAVAATMRGRRSKKAAPE